MTKLLLSLHVLAAIVAVGPVTVAASMFPPAVRRAAPAEADGPAPKAVTAVTLLHRICRVYARLGVLVPALGLATALAMGVLGDGWLIASITLTAVAAGVLLAFVLPRQDELVGRLAAHQPADPQDTVRLAVFTGVFNLLWATVTVLMIVRPGSTTGA
ncbi:membrane protein [Streptomyces toyocaensis]|uniref:Membrane protein n=1 Tax=Streptomyces toyocaensis TaxID=55952 RepID=A0A081XXM4_STRTO|nr:membrane protein [Streptomyces toyocaensis]KES08297.1 membrane protein [Streptomyces toyocaensis]